MSKIDKKLWKSIISLQKNVERYETAKREVSLEIKTSDRILVIPLSDLHLGGGGTDYRGILKFLDLVKDKKNVFIIDLGDRIDNFQSKAPTLGFRQIVDPDIQKQMVSQFLGSLQKQFLCILQGNHEERSWKSDSFCHTSFLADKFTIPNLLFGGFLNLKVGKVDYKFLLRHKYRFRSSFNLTHTCKRLLETWGNADIVIVAHQHCPSFEMTPHKYQEQKVFIRPGSFLVKDRWAESQGYLDAIAEFPCIILNPRRKEMTPLMGIEQGLKILRLLK
jgi:predicted phosphodiesterase